MVIYICRKATKRREREKEYGKNERKKAYNTLLTDRICALACDNACGVYGAGGKKYRGQRA